MNLVNCKLVAFVTTPLDGLPLAGALCACLAWAAGAPVLAEEGPSLQPEKAEATAHVETLPAPVNLVESGAEINPAAGGAVPTVESLAAQDDPPPLPAENQIWLISTRGTRYCGCKEARLKYWRYDCGRWHAASQAEFLAQDDPRVPTCFFVHGNRISSGQANFVGWRAYRRLKRASLGQPFRFVIWSWPSSQIRGQLRDVRAKAYRADAEAFYLAWQIDRIKGSVPVSLLGYSYGARLSSGALHMLGGGQLAGRALSQRVHPNRAPLRAVLMAAAFENYWLLPGRRHGQALTQVDRLLVLKNPTDGVLRHYAKLYGIFRHAPYALGATGIAGWGTLGADRAKIAQMNVSGWVGTAHDWRRYVESPTLIARMRPYALFADE